jgi:hypothetical protein
VDLNDAQKIAKIIGTADNGCDTCVGELVSKLNGQFPRFVWAATGERVDDMPDFDGPHTDGIIVEVATSQPSK